MSCQWSVYAPHSHTAKNTPCEIPSQLIPLTTGLAKDFDYPNLIRSALGCEQSWPASGTIKSTSEEVRKVTYSPTEVNDIITRDLTGRYSARSQVKFPEISNERKCPNYPSHYRPHDRVKCPGREGIDGVAYVHDNILVWGNGPGEYERSLEGCLKCLVDRQVARVPSDQHGLVGWVLIFSEDGMSPNPRKINHRIWTTTNYRRWEELPVGLPGQCQIYDGAPLGICLAHRTTTDA